MPVRAPASSEDWSQYPATQDVDIDNNDIDNVANISGHSTNNSLAIATRTFQISATSPTPVSCVVNNIGTDVNSHAYLGAVAVNDSAGSPIFLWNIPNAPTGAGSGSLYTLSLRTADKHWVAVEAPGSAFDLTTNVIFDYNPVARLFEFNKFTGLKSQNITTTDAVSISSTLITVSTTPTPTTYTAVPCVRIDSGATPINVTLEATLEVADREIRICNIGSSTSLTLLSSAGPPVAGAPISPGQTLTLQWDAVAAVWRRVSVGS